jgi:hypothetical protein
MKKYFIALILGMGLLSMQTASAATLSLNGSPAGAIVAGTSGTFSLTVAGAIAGDILQFYIPSSATSPTFGGTGIMNFSLTNAGQVTPLFDGLTTLVVGGTSSFVAAIGHLDNNVFVPDAAVPSLNTPIPAAMWLFGSALMGLVGVARRKSQAVLAA